MPPAPSRPYRLGTAPDSPWQALARVRFGSPVAPLAAEAITVGLPVLAGPAEEFWTSPLPVTRGESAGLRYAENGELLFGQIGLSEAALQQAGMSRAVFHVYARINHLLHERGYPHWLRMWNYLERIVEGEGDEERYRHFNRGRAKALELKRDFQRQLPAATAIGMADGGLTIYFVGARNVAGVQVENPRQVSAFHYPRQYGARAPSFSRATRVEWADGSDLFVSGTASVVGHETRHVGDLPAQLDETLTNIEALLDVAQAQRGHGGAYRPLLLKLYLRDPDTLPALRGRLDGAFGDAPLTVLAGTVCRRDLALEIEGVFTAPP